MAGATDGEEEVPGFDRGTAPAVFPVRGLAGAPPAAGCEEPEPAVVPSTRWWRTMIVVGGGAVAAGSGGAADTVVGVTVSTLLVPAAVVPVAPLPHDIAASNKPVALMLTPPTRIRLAAAVWRRALRRPPPVVGSVILVFGLWLVVVLDLVLVVVGMLRRRDGRVPRAGSWRRHLGLVLLAGVVRDRHPGAFRLSRSFVV